jgi:DNA ligase-1
MINKLMLSCNTLPNIDTEINYPVLASGKLDGVRGCVQEQQLVSRSLKAHTLNRHATSYLSRAIFEGLDGELCLAGESWNNFNANQSAFTTQSGEPKFIWHVFDDISKPFMSAHKRKTLAKERAQVLFDLGYPVFFCEQELIYDPSSLRYMYDKKREEGYEGLILTDPNGLYKHGRSTLKQGTSLKLKPSSDSEALVIDFIELEHNLDAGNSIKKENMVPGNMLGALIVRWNGVMFNIGTGFSLAQRIEIWTNRDKYLNAFATFKYMEVFPDTGIPRSPVFKGFRAKVDFHV